MEEPVDKPAELLLPAPASNLILLAPESAEAPRNVSDAAPESPRLRPCVPALPPVLVAAEQMPPGPSNEPYLVKKARVTAFHQKSSDSFWAKMEADFSTPASQGWLQNLRTKYGN